MTVRGAGTTKKAISLTLDIDIVEKLRREAKKERRSISNYLNTILRKEFPEVR